MAESNGKLEVSEEPTLEELAQIDFSGKSEALKELDTIVKQAAIERTESNLDTLSNVYLMMYKGNGPIETVLFRSDRPSPVIIRDCQVWCAERSYRFISFKRALVDLFKRATREEMSGNVEGDITNLVTRQSRNDSLKAV